MKINHASNLLLDLTRLYIALIVILLPLLISVSIMKTMPMQLPTAPTF